MQLSKSTRIWIGILSIAVVLVGSYIIYSEMKWRFDTDNANAIPLAGGVVLELDDAARDYTGPMPEDRGGGHGIAMPGYKSITIPADTTDVQMALLNPEGNPCYFTFELVLRETGETLYASKMVEPAKSINEVTLIREMESGEYPLTIKIRTFQMETLAVMNGANVETTLIVV